MRGGARLVAAAAAIAIASCSACGSPEEPAVSSTPGPEPVPPPEQVQPAPPEPEPPAEPAVPPVVVFLEAEGDLDGDGTAERLTFDSAGTLRAGQWSTQSDLGGIEEEVFRDQASLRVVELDRRRHLRALLLEVPTTVTEDPPNRHQFFVLDGDTLRPIHDMTIGSYGAIDLEIPGDGTVRYLEDGWTACTREEAGGAGFATRQHVILRVDRRGESIVPSRRTSGPRQDCSQLAACPFVDVIGPDGAAQRVGEILRDLRGEDAYSLQSLELPVAGGPLRFRLVEEKPEVTYVDELYVEVDGLRIAPRACAGVAPPAYCVADHRMHLLGLGDVLEIEVEVPQGRAPPLLFARGYYVPTPDR